MTINKSALKRATRFFKSTEQIHRDGVAEFGVAWLRANEAIVGIARSFGFEPSESDAKQFFSVTAYIMMRHGRFARKKGAKR